MYVTKKIPRLGSGQELDQYSKFNYTALSQHIKGKLQNLSCKFWLANYALEENRQEHATHGRLWKQIGCCFSLLVFRMIGRVFK